MGRQISPKWEQHDEHAAMAERFEEHRGYLRAVAYRIVGSLPEADDAVQDAWIRFSLAGSDGVHNLRSWLTTIVARVCLNTLRARAARREDVVGVHAPNLVTAVGQAVDPEREVLLADSVGQALMVVLDALPPAERVAFVLHDLFDVPFDEIAEMVERSATAARKLASRARHRVRRAGVPNPSADLPIQRALVDAFFAAARRGEFDQLVALLDPDVTLRSDGGTAHPEAAAVLYGATAVARRALAFARPAANTRPALINGAAAVVITAADRPVYLLGFAIVRGRIAEIRATADPQRINQPGVAILDNRA